MLCLFVMGDRIGIAEDFQEFVWFKVDAHRARLHQCLYCCHHPPQLAHPFSEQSMLPSQEFKRIGVRIVERRFDLVERKAKLAIAEDTLQSLQVGD